MANSNARKVHDAAGTLFQATRKKVSNGERSSAVFKTARKGEQLTLEYLRARAVSRR